MGKLPGGLVDLFLLSFVKLSEEKLTSDRRIFSYSLRKLSWDSGRCGIWAHSFIIW